MYSTVSSKLRPLTPRASIILSFDGGNTASPSRVSVVAPKPDIITTGVTSSAKARGMMLNAIITASSSERIFFISFHRFLYFKLFTLGSDNSVFHVHAADAGVPAVAAEAVLLHIASVIDGVPFSAVFDH